MKRTTEDSKLMKDISYIHKKHVKQSLSAHEIADELKETHLQPPDLTDAEVETAMRMMRG